MIPYLSVFSPNAGKYGPEKLRIRTLFSQWFSIISFWLYGPDALKYRTQNLLFKTISEKKLFNLVLKLNKNDDDEWWIVFVVWLTDKRRLVLFPAGTIARDPHRRESPTRRKQDFSCAEPELRISWIKLCSSDSDYTTAPIMTGALVVLENTCSKIRSVRKKNIIGIKCVSSEMVALIQSRN